MNFTFEKNFGGGSLCTGGAAGIWAMHIFSSTYFGEISIFGLSKDQTFRIWSTFMNPEQFLLLVPYLLIFSVIYDIFSLYSRGVQLKLIFRPSSVKNWGKMVKISTIQNRVWIAVWTLLPYSNDLRYRKIPFRKSSSRCFRNAEVKNSTDDLSKKLSINFHLVERMGCANIRLNSLII
jgi:hypothetical protein